MILLKKSLDHVTVVAGQVLETVHFELGLAINSEPVSGPDFFQISLLRFKLESKIGNDDVSFADEDNNAYRATQKLNLAHQYGEMSSTDRPNFLMQHSVGEDSHSFGFHMQFGEFTRVALGDKWFRVSDFVDWRVFYKVVKRNGKWENNGSLITRDNRHFENDEEN